MQKEKQPFEPPLSQRLQQMVSSSTSAAEGIRLREGDNTSRPRI